MLKNPFKKQPENIERDSDGWPAWLPISGLTYNGLRIDGGKKGGGKEGFNDAILDRDKKGGKEGFKDAIPYDIQIGTDDRGQYLLLNQESTPKIQISAVGDISWTSGSIEDAEADSILEMAKELKSDYDAHNIILFLEQNASHLEAAFKHAHIFDDYKSERAFWQSKGINSESPEGIDDVIRALTSHGFLYNKISGTKDSENLNAGALTNRLKNYVLAIESGEYSEDPVIDRTVKYRVVQRVNSENDGVLEFPSTPMQDWIAVLSSKMGAEGNLAYEVNAKKNNNAIGFSIKRGANNIGSLNPHSSYVRGESSERVMEKARVRGYLQSFYLVNDNGKLQLYLGGNMPGDMRGKKDEGTDYFTEMICKSLEALGVTNGFYKVSNRAKDMIKVDLNENATIDNIAKTLYWAGTGLQGSDGVKTLNPALFSKIMESYPHYESIKLGKL